MVCCSHGVPTFPHWHRLYMVQFETELLARGSGLGLPYWDWIQDSAIPALANDETYQPDPEEDATLGNPFYNGEVQMYSNNTVTSRAANT
jgi:hypothetical protein